MGRWARIRWPALLALGVAAGWIGWSRIRVEAPARAGAEASGAGPPGVISADTTPLNGHRLHGHRLLERDPAGGPGMTPRFDAAALPVVVIRGGAPAPSQPAGRIVDARGRACRLEAEVHAIEGGWRISTRLTHGVPEPGRGRLILDDGPNRIVDRPIRWALAPAALPGLDAVVAARQAGDAAAARRALGAIPHPDPEQALWIPVEAARIAVMHGDLAGARAAWLDGARLAAERGMPGEQARRLNAAAWVALTERDFVAMDRLTAAAEALASGIDDPENRANIEHMRGVLALETGDWRAAASRFDRAQALAARLGLHRVERLVVESQALALGALGRHADALAALDRIRPALSHAAALDRSRFQVNVGWLELGAERPDRARRAFEAALIAAGQPDAEQPARLANIELNLAHAAFEAGDRAAARSHLRRARGHGADDTQGLATQMLDARLALADGRVDAEARFRDVEIRARSELAPDGGDVAWRALHGRGRALRSQDPVAAAALFARALDEMARQGTRAGLLGPRGAFFAARRALVADAYQLALDRGDASAAFGIADRDRARVLRAARTRLRVQRLAGADRAAWLERAGALAAARDALAALRGRADLVAGDARQRWRAAVDDAEARRRAAFEQAVALLDRAAPVEPSGADGADGRTIAAHLSDDTWLVAFTRIGERWHAQRVTSAGVDDAVIDGHDPLAPWRAQLSEAGHIYLISGGHPRGFALAREPQGADPPLLITHTVAWLPFAGLLLRAPGRGAGPPLIVADPALDLPHARSEGRALAGMLPGARLLIGADATAEALGESSVGARLIHFSGHGVLRQARPWDAHLRLAGGHRFDVVDVLGLRLDGARVVLNGCETGPEALLLRDDVLGLPEAFLAAGAASVIATDRPVDDRAARRFTEAFYAAGGLTDPAGALRAVARSARARGAAAWSAWRLLGVR